MKFIFVATARTACGIETGGNYSLSPPSMNPVATARTACGIETIL